MAQTVKTLPAMCETWVQSLGWKDPLEKGMCWTKSSMPEEDFYVSPEDLEEQIKTDIAKGGVR